MDPVIIVGAGLGGLLLALLLDQAPTPIPYTILERSTERKWPLEGGGVIFLTPQIHPLLERLGILDALREISRPVATLTVYERRYKLGFDPTMNGAGATGTSPQGKGSASAGSEPKMSGFEGGDDNDDDDAFVKSRYDYDTLAISRPELYNFLVDRLPEEKLVLGKQVQELVFQDIAHDERSAAPAPALPVSVPAGNNRRNEIGRGTEVELEDGVQQAEGVGAERGAMTTTTMPLIDISGSTPTTTAIAAVVCADGSRYEGIIIGADGTYSTVRLSLDRHLREQGLMTTAAAADKEEVNEDRHHGPMRAQFRVLVGMTRELDPDRFELLKSEYSDVRVLVSKGVHPFAFWCVPMTGNKICWILEERLVQEQICPEIEDFTQDQQAISQLCESVRSIPSSYKGVTVGEIILDSTPKGTPALLPREEGFLHSTWTHGNVALMGDACHKALPYTGQPITLAGQDAVKLANVLYAHSLDTSLACSPPLPSSYNTTASSHGTLLNPSISISSNSSFPPAGCPHETERRRRGSDIEKRLRSYEAERRTEAEHAVRRAGRVSRLLLPLPLPLLSSFDVRDPESSYDEGKEERERELQELFAGAAGLCVEKESRAW